MQLSDFSTLAKDYIHRAGYSRSVLDVLAYHVGAYTKDDFIVADVGAGTGKMTEMLVELGLSGFAIEPNDYMREEGINYTNSKNFIWTKGSGEFTGLGDSSVDWIIMASSFHWTDQLKALDEFYRILKPQGFFTAIWNPRDLGKSELHTKIESIIYSVAPSIKRVSSGSKEYTQNLENDLVKNDLFCNLLFTEGMHEVLMSKDRYMGAWKSVNDIQAQAGQEKFQQILSDISDFIGDVDSIYVPYKTRAWTVQSKKVD